MSKRILLLGVLAATAIAMTPIPSIARTVYVEVEPPPPRAEIAPANRHGWVWAPGHWRWNGRQYVWIGGHWIRERHGMYWVPEHWVRDGYRHRFVPGHWER